MSAIIDINEIKQYIPHRYPFLLVDRIVELEIGKRIVGLKLAKVAERLQRHYDLECHYDEPLSDALVSACLLPDAGARSIDSLLNQQILPVLSQQLLQRQAARQPSHRVTMGYSEELGVSLQFADGATEA